MQDELIIYVYECWSQTTPALLGTLYVTKIRGYETYAFEYDEDWLNLNKNCQYVLDPNLYFYQGRQFASGQNVFGIFSDSCPDRWGKLLMKRKESLQAIRENRKPNKLSMTDYLLGVYDKTRMGALRFKLDKNGEFLANDSSETVPPWANLRDLEEAARGFESSSDDNEDNWLKQLVLPGSSLGGARPKANVIDTNGDLWIAKFPSKHDENDTGAWEKVTSELARLCHLNVPETMAIKFSVYGHTFLTKRFDRKGTKRIHFSSAMTLLGKNDGASASDGSSYLELVEFIKAYGTNPNDDIKELWHRIIFNAAVSNTDDHLRNHGFLLDVNGWKLSPLYDVNPIPYGNSFALNITEADNTISLNNLLIFASLIDLDEASALDDIRFILSTVNNNWISLAKKFNLSRESIIKMDPAFSFTKDSIVKL